MKAIDIPNYEFDFKQNKIDTAGKKFSLSPLTVSIPGSQDRLTVMRCKPVSGDESFIYKVSHAKERIVLHFTSGYLKGDVGVLTKPNYHVSVPFLVARDGTIYNLWSSKYWSYHLGRGAVGQLS